MDRETLRNLRLDRRLLRRGGLSEDELQRELEKLPDASEKMTTLGDAADASDASGDDDSTA